MQSLHGRFTSLKCSTRDTEQQRTVSRFVTDLKRCSRSGDLEGGKKLHKDAIEAKLHTNKYIAAVLIKLYSICHCMSFARQVFDHVGSADVVLWNSLIQGYVENGNGDAALEIFAGMNCQPSTVTYVVVLKACACLSKYKLDNGIIIHGQVERLGYSSDVAVVTTLLDMYTKCSCLVRAKQVFDQMSHNDVVTWNILIFGYVINGQPMAAVSLQSTMTCQPDTLTYVAIVKAYGQIATERPSLKPFCLEKALTIHKQVDASEIILANSLIDMYGKCGSVESARHVFDKMNHRDVITWNSLITTYVDNREFLLALEIFTCMDSQPDSVTCLLALKACGGLAMKGELHRCFCMEQGMFVHKIAASKLGFGADLSMPTTLVDMYSKCGSMHHARKVFDVTTHRDTITWNSLLLGYVENGECSLAIDLFSCMNTQPDSFTYVAVLKATGALNLDREFRLEKSTEYHKQASERLDVYPVNTLLDVYCKCGGFHLARKLFESMSSRDVVSWNTLLVRYVENGDFTLAMKLFIRMNCEPDSVTYVAALKACIGLATARGFEKESGLKIGVAIHKQASDGGLVSDLTVSNTLIEMYSKCGSWTRAKEVFDEMLHRNIVAWNSIILGCVENGESMLALEIFNSMSLEPDTYTYVAVIKAWGSLSTLPAGKSVHARVCQLGLEQEQVVVNALTDFYIKSGSMNVGELLFSSMHSPDLVSWNTLVTGYSSGGSSSRVLRLARELEQSGLQMDDVTFTCVLAACSHAGLVKEAKVCFESGVRQRVRFRVEHFNCMVDMLGRANRLQEALDFIKRMPSAPNSVTWMTLLAACRRWNNLQVGQVAFDALESCSRDKAAAYVFLSGIYAGSDKKNMKSQAT